MISDQELAGCVESLLRQAGPSGAIAAAESADGVVRQLEAKLGLDLSHKAAFIQDHIHSLLGLRRPHFALHPYPNFHPNPNFPTPLHLQFPAGFHLPLTHHNDIAIRHHPPPIPTASPSATPEAAQQYQDLQPPSPQQQQQEPPPQDQEPSVVPAPVPTPAPKESSAGVKRRGGPGGLNKVCGVSPELQAIVGEPTMARTQIVKQLWAYIRKNNLQDPNNKRKIICNDELRLVFETDCTDMFKMNKLLAKHITTLQPTKDLGQDPGPDCKKVKTSATELDFTAEHDAGQNRIVISGALAQFLGTEERKMLQSEALMHVWDYIKANQLEDPMNPMVILCDSKLEQLFGCESFSALRISQMLASHLSLLFEQS